MKISKIIFYVLCSMLCTRFLNAQEPPILVINPQGHSDRITNVMFTPDGKRLISVSDDKTIRLWDVETGDLIKTIRGQISDGPEGLLFDGKLSPDGKVLAVAVYPSHLGIRLFNIESGEQIGLLKGHTNVIHTLDLSHDGKLLASGSGDKTVKIWDVIQKKEITTLEGHKDNVYDVAFSPDGEKLVSVALDNICILWNLRTQKIIKKMERHTNFVTAVAYSPDGKYIVSGGFDDKILLWDANGKFIKEIGTQDNLTISFSKNSKKIVVVGDIDDPATIYSIPLGEKIITFTKHDDIVVASAFYGNDLIATAGGQANDIYIWDANSGAVKTHIVGNGNKVWAIAFGEGLNIGFGNNYKWISDSNQGMLEKSFDFSEMSLNQKLPDEINFKRARTEYLGTTIERIDRWTLKIGKKEIQQDSKSDQGIRCYSFTIDGNIIVGSVWSLKMYRNDGTLMKEFIGHTGEVWAVSVEQSGRILASASSDQTIKLWNIQSGELLATLFVTKDNEWICWTPQGYYAASAGGEKYVGWHINQGIDKAAKYYPVDRFRKLFYNPELVTRAIELASFQDAFAEYNRKSNKKIERETIARVLPPEVTWISPNEYYARTNKNSFIIKAKITSDTKILTLKVLVNGSTVATTSKIKNTKDIGHFDKVIEYEVPLNPQKNEIRIYAENINAFTTSKEIVVYSENIDWMKPNLYMLSIGISDYQHDKILSYAVDDALAMSQIFTTQEGRLFKKIYIKSLYNLEATYGKIIDALEWLDENATQKDVVVVFIAAHGYKEKENYYILPVEGDPNNLRRTAVDWRDYKDILGNLPCKVLLFLDTCYSGQLAMDLFTARGDGKSRINNTEAIRELTSEEFGVVIMAASTGTEISQEHPKWGHGAFTKALIEGLKDGKADKSGDGIIYLQELDFHVTDRVKELTNGAQHAKTNFSPNITISRFPIFQLESK